MDFDNIHFYSQSELESILDEASDNYYNTDQLTLTDQEFDFIKEYLITTFPMTKYKSQIGSDSAGKIDLPVWMGSMDNIKTEKKINSWISKFPNDYVIMSKLDGISALLHKNGSITKFYTRGNGKQGKDISHLLKYLQIPDLSSYTDITIRGELVVKLDTYKKIKTQSANERSFVSGIVNTKKPNVKDIKYIDFVAYELMYPEFKISQQLKKLSNLGFNTVLNASTKTINYSSLKHTFNSFIEKSDYLIDGIIIRHDQNYSYNKSGNPDFAFAFKMVLENQIETTSVIKVNWNVSKFGKLFPQIQIKPIKIGGNIINFVSGKSGKFIYSNNIGPGTIIEVIRSCDVIPDIHSIIKESKCPDMPECDYKWNETNVDIFSIDTDENETVQIKLIQDFFKKINTSYIGPGLVDKLYNNGYNTIKKIIHITKKQLLQIPGIKETSSTKILDSINKSINDATIIDIMNASNIFGRGFGRRKLEALYNSIPDLIDKSANQDLIDEIEEVEGFSTISATQFVKNFNSFKKFLKDLNINTHNLLNYIPMSKDTQNVVFTGFRNSELEQKLLQKHITVNSSINSNTFIIVRKDDSVESSKIKEARKKKIKIMNVTDFIKYLSSL